MAPKTDGGSNGDAGTPKQPVITAAPDHEIKLKPDQVEKLAQIFVQKVGMPLEEAKSSVEEAEPTWYNFGLAFDATEIMHIQVKAVTEKNIDSYAKKTVEHDLAEALHITAKVWREAEEKSKTKGHGE